MRKILQSIIDSHGIPYFVGGCVRDEILGIESKDVDIEVYGLEADELVKILSKFGKVDCVGSFFWCN